VTCCPQRCVTSLSAYSQCCNLQAVLSKLPSFTQAGSVAGANIATQMLQATRIKMLLDQHDHDAATDPWLSDVRTDAAIGSATVGGALTCIRCSVCCVLFAC
jgi:hypothetical protein